MSEVFFYHLTRAPLEVTLRLLLEKSLAAGWRVAVRGRSRDMLERLDEQLWLKPEDSFLPHGLAGG
ncbi:MAG: DNA polymerase III subunit chi, partial [Pseudomonadota bacterium]